MEDDVFPSNITMSGTLSDTNSGGFDFMDELFLSGGWFESATGSDFLQPGPSGSPALFDSVYSFPSSDLSNGKSNANPNNQEEGERLIFRENPPLIEPETLSLNQNTIEIAKCSTQQESHLAEGCLELSTRGWIELREDPVPVTSVRERLMQALQYIKESTKDREILIQMWVPIERGGKHVLTTNDQPFSLDPNCQRLANYRNVSMNYQFAVEEHSKESTGLPGRVYLGKVPEWTPDVQLFSSDEYPRIVYAQHYDVRGTFALPVFEPGSRTCLGVIEVVMTTQKMSYRPDLEIICKALEAVDLRSSEISSSPNVKVCNESYQKALPEILEVLRAVCMTHRLPLAQTWVPCIQQGKQGCRHSDENYAYCVSTLDSACYVTDPQIWGFHEACSEHHLLRGQGLVGRAFMTNQPCFSTNITTLSKIGYPLSHHARIFGLRAAVAIRLRSIYTGMADYVLELFLPVDCQETEEQKTMLNSLSIIIQRVCRSLRVVTDKELEEETIPQISEVVAVSHGRHNTEEIPKFVSSPPEGSSQEESSWSVDITTTQQKGKSVQMEFRKEQPTEEFKITTHWDNPNLVLHQGQTVSEHKQHHQDSRPKNSIECGRSSSSIGGSRFPSAGKTGEKRRTKTERTISLQVLRQHFAGSLKDAAKSIGVCPTTLKRICRQHGITRWPSRKIKKVGHSLRKLQVVIDSVHGAEGTFQIESFYANFQDLTSPNLSGTNQLSKLNATDHPNLVNMQTEGTISPETALSKSSSSSQSQSSSSSLCCSSRAEQRPHAANIAGSKDASVAENPVGVLKRAHSDAELNALSEQAPRLLGKSHSHKSLHENPSLESLPPLPNSRSSVSRNRGGLKVKVTFGEDKIRFSMQHNWGFKDLQQEIARRFSIDDVSGIDLKYLDDDSEWVLLTCDADLEECMDIYKSFQIHTIKLSVCQISQPNLRSSMGSSGPS